MTILSALYKLLIGPLELVFEFIFSVANRVTGRPALAIVLLSLAVNLLVLPMYRRADAMQREERDLEERLRPMADHIRRTFRGDERFMMLQTYYRQNGYRPAFALKGSLSLLLQVPFFIAAYNFLSGLQLLHGVSLGPIRDLGAPDAMFAAAGFDINVLPLLMTAVNAVSSAIYLRGFPLKSKLQVYGMALLFLALLYTSPAGLVFYWTLNNLFSLGKNLFYKSRDPGRLLAVCFSAAGVLLLAYFVFIRPFDTPRREAVAVAGLLLLQLPLAARLFPDRLRPSAAGDAGQDGRLFLTAGIFLTLLTGVLIPTAVIKAAPEDFVNAAAYHSPLWYAAGALLTAAGVFLVWLGVFYRMASPSGKRYLTLALVLSAGWAAADYMLFGTNYGDISPELVYYSTPANSMRDYFLNLAVLAAVAGVLFLLRRRRPSALRLLILTLCLAAGSMSVMNTVAIQRELTAVKAGIEESLGQTPRFSLSRKGKNVVVLMMDRSIGYYIPFLMQEKPALREQFAGFTYYPNTVSFGTNTNVGTPPLYGGYEYTPAEINRRSRESLMSKQNEALKVMPVLFDSNGYDVTVIDPTYAGYRDNPYDIHIYDEYPRIHKYATTGKFAVPEVAEALRTARFRNFFCFSLYKIAPLVLQPTLYTNGLYNDADALAGLGEDLSWQTIGDDLLTATGVDWSFQEALGTLIHLSDMTEIRDDDADTFMMMDNQTTHAMPLLQLPDYTVSPRVDNRPYESSPARRSAADGRVVELRTHDQATHYHSNMAAFTQLGLWLDYLRENGVYDNTRIIIVADHGFNLDLPGCKFGPEFFEDVLWYNPTLMVKDFGAAEFTTDGQFMTNADVPTLAFQGLIDAPVNPFTGNPIRDDEKTAHPQQVQYVSVWDVRVNNGNTFLPTYWYSVHDDIFALDNWQYLGKY